MGHDIKLCKISYLISLFADYSVEGTAVQYMQEKTYGPHNIGVAELNIKY